MPEIDESASDDARTWIGRMTSGTSGHHGDHITDEMQTTMMEKVGIYRNEKEMLEAVDKIQELRKRYLSVLNSFIQKCGLHEMGAN